MLPRQHLTYSTAAAVGLLPLLRCRVIAFWLASWAIDVDHYLWYVWQYRSLNLFQAYRHFKREHGKPFSKSSRRPRAIVVFHTFEILLALAWLSWRWGWTRAALFGMLFHLGLDAIEDRRTNGFLDREYSLIGIVYDRLFCQRQRG